eukprot:Skav201854  [mRNA]  locus=scaffold484:337708:339166:- [translate_table: standard]
MIPWNTYDSFEANDNCESFEPFVARVSTLEYFETVSTFSTFNPLDVAETPVARPELCVSKIDLELFEESSYAAKVTPVASVPEEMVTPVATHSSFDAPAHPSDVQKLSTYDFFEEHSLPPIMSNAMSNAMPMTMPCDLRPPLLGDMALRMPAFKRDVSNSSASTTPSTPSCTASRSCQLSGAALHIAGKSGKEIIRWNVDGRKLESQDKQILSPEFDLQLPGVESSTPFRLMILAKETRGKGCRGFLKAKGRSRFFIKCGRSSVAAAVAFRITVAPGTAAEESKVLRPHQFADRSCCPLQEDKEDWRLLSVVDNDSKHFEVMVEVLHDN